MSVPPTNAELIFSSEHIERAIDRLAVKINLDFTNQSVTFLCLLYGAVPFTWDLVRRLDIDLEIEFLRVRRYRGKAGFEPKRLDGNLANLESKTVIILDDVHDEGYTLEFVLGLLGDLPARVILAVLVKKEGTNKSIIEADYFALAAPNRYLIGRGMDLDGKCRDLTGIYAIDS